MFDSSPSEESKVSRSSESRPTGWYTCVSGGTTGSFSSFFKFVSGSGEPGSLFEVLSRFCEVPGSFESFFRVAQ